MSNCGYNLNSNISNKRAGNSKYLNSFFPATTKTTEKQIAKRQKIDSLETVDSKIKHNRINDCATEGKAIRNDVNQLSHDVNWASFGIPFRSDYVLSKSDATSSKEGLNKQETNQSTSNSYLDDEEESWFQGCIGAVVEKCTQVEAEVGIKISRVEIQDSSKIEINDIILNSESNNKLLRTKQNVNSKSLKNSFCSSQRLIKTPLRRTASGTEWPTTYNNSRPVLQNHPVFNSKTKLSDRDSGSLNTNKNETKKLVNELKAFKDKYQTKEGEVRLLRANLDLSKTDLQNHKLQRLKANEIVQSEMNKKIRNYEKEIHSLKAQLQFNKMEVVIAQSQQVLHPPDITRFCAKPSENLPDRSVFSPKNVSSSKKESEITTKEVILMEGDLVEACGDIQVCQLLLELIAPELFYKSEPETAALDPPLFSSNLLLKSKTGSVNKKQRNSRLNIDCAGKDEHSTTLLQTTCLTVEPCYQPLITLTKMVDLSNRQAHDLLLKILIESMKLLEELLLRLKSSTLREHLMDREIEMYESWHTYVPLNINYNLLDFRPWYDGEKGVEARRCLGLLSILVQLSKFVMTRILPAFDSSTDGQDTTYLCGDGFSSNQIDKLGLILYTIRDIIEEIGNQRRTLSFEGVLTGAIELILSLTKNEVELSEDCQQIVLDILKRVIFARPGSTVLLKAVKLLSEAVRYPFLTNQLCCKTAQKTCIEDYWDITFTFDTCVVQMLCFMIRQLPEDFRYKLTDTFVSWLYPLFILDQEGPLWLYLPPDSTRCQCRSLISQLTITVLDEVCRKYEKGDIQDKKILEKLLPAAVFLVQNLVYQDEHFPVNVGEYRGKLVLFLEAMKNLKTEVKLHPVICKILEKISSEEDLRKFSTPSVESDELHSLLSSIYIGSEL